MMKGIVFMIAAMMQMFAEEPLKEETIFDLEFDEIEIPDGGRCQVQFYITPLDGFDAVGVDWGDGTVQDWPSSQYTMWHNWTTPGKYRVKLDRRLKWFRFTECWTTAESRTYASRPLLRPIQWGDYVESANGTYAGWNSTREGRGIRGPVIPWGKSIKTTFCCYERDKYLTGTFPKWGPKVTDCTGTYQYCTGLGGEIPEWPAKATAGDSCYTATGATGVIPAWPETMTSARMCYQECAGLTGAWTDDPALLMPERMNGQQGLVTDHDHVVKDASDAIRALFYEDWGGTRARPE